MASQTPAISRAFDDVGSGAALVLLHGFPLDRRIWSHQVAKLSGSMRVIAPDLRGFGENTDEGPFSLDELADDVKRLIDSLGLDKVVLAGLSMGGYVAAAFAVRYPQSLRGLILIDTKTEADTPEGKAGRDKMIALANEKGSAAVAEQMLPKMLAPEALNANGPAVAQLRQMMEACPPATIAHALAAMRERPDRTADLVRLAVPTLIVVGQHDAIIPPATAAALASKIPGARAHEVAGAGHMAPFESPQDVNGAIRDFVTPLV
ncbi:MAG TPA: alpha/beta fold hydrolase [Tepidisphaeraceae bacterium]|jgi:pimeloyl-ACP methyl ester carboxylesterase|nr:alpha/beta fold hydrolase [Tepidisphaeraceae bacterium]